MTKQLDARVRFLAGPATGTFGRITALDEARWSADVRLDDGRLARNVPMKHLEVVPEANVTDREKLLDRVRKLHAKAESARALGNDAEALAFAAGVQKMLAKYRLDMSELEMQTFERLEPIDKSYVYGDKRKARVAWAELLASVVARAHYCRILVVSGSDTIVLVGRPTDRAVAEFVFTTLRRTADENSDRDARAFRRQQRATFGATTGQAKDFRAAWLNAFVNRIAQRYDEERAAMQQEATAAGTSLVRLSNALADVDRHMQSSMRVGRAKHVASRSSSNAAGSALGRAAGNAASIRGTGLGAGNTTSQRQLT
jgi:hypothetical protein